MRQGITNMWVTNRWTSQSSANISRMVVMAVGGRRAGMWKVGLEG